MDPRVPTSTSREVVEDTDAATGQTIRKTTATSPTQASQEVSTESMTPTGRQVHEKKTVGASAAYAKEYGQKKTIFHAYQILWYILGLLEIILVIRFLLKVFGANPQSGFADFVYTISGLFVSPFTGLFSPATTEGAETTAILEWSTIIAAIIYALIVWGIMKLIRLMTPTDPEKVEREIQDN